MDLTEISASIQSGSGEKTEELIMRAMSEDYSLTDIVKEGMITGIQAVKERYQKNDIFVPDVLASVRAMNCGITAIENAIPDKRDEIKGVVVIGTVKGEIRDIEKPLFSVMMQVSGFRVIDLGTSVASKQFIETAVKEHAFLICCSAALVANLVQMKELVSAAVSAGIRNRVKIMISGGPVTKHYCRSIGADIYAPDAVKAAEMAVTCTGNGSGKTAALP
jgi:methanogenic corrinoid protein MtbC1